MWRRFLSRGANQAWQVNKVARAASPGEQYSMHRVRLKPSRSYFRRVVGYGTTAIVCYYVWDYTTFLPIRNLDQKIVDEIENEDDDDDDDSLDPFFISLPFTEKKVQPPPYSARGKEWQDFIAFERDKKRRTAVMDELKLMVKKAVETQMLGGQAAKLGSSYLVVTYPLKPPPEVVRWGIEFNDEGIALTTRPYDARTKAHIDRVIKPYPMINGTYAFAKAVVQQSVDAVTNFIGYTPVNKSFTTATIDPDLTKALKKLEARQAAHGGPGSSSSSGSQSSMSPSGSDSSPRSEDITNNADSSRDSRDSGKPVNKDITPLYSTLGETSRPLQAFQQDFARAWKPLRHLPPRGSIAVHGLVAIDGPKSRIYIDVLAWYHPGTCSFDRGSSVMHLKAISPFRQLPLRP